MVTDDKLDIIEDWSFGMLVFCNNGVGTDEGRKCHRFCNHSGAGLSGLKMERNRHQRTEIEENATLPNEQQLLMEKKAIIIQRAWRALLGRKQGWQEVPKNRINHLDLVSREDAFPANLPTGELGQNLTL
ncbi:schwannomin-interacting protein 1 isoform X1, partial [Tachysurus ichikawai]